MIGKGGAVIRALTEETGTTIDIRTTAPSPSPPPPAKRPPWPVRASTPSPRKWNRQDLRRHRAEDSRFRRHRPGAARQGRPAAHLPDRQGARQQRSRTTSRKARSCASSRGQRVPGRFPAGPVQGWIVLGKLAITAICFSLNFLGLAIDAKGGRRAGLQRRLMPISTPHLSQNRNPLRRCGPGLIDLLDELALPVAVAIRSRYRFPGSPESLGSAKTVASSNMVFSCGRYPRSAPCEVSRILRKCAGFASRSCIPRPSWARKGKCLWSSSSAIFVQRPRDEKAIKYRNPVKPAKQSWHCRQKGLHWRWVRGRP